MHALMMPQLPGALVLAIADVWLILESFSCRESFSSQKFSSFDKVFCK
jgi:hypothetical protein